MTNKPSGIPAVYKLARLLCRDACANFFHSEVVGQENIPNEGPIIIAPNHQSFLDIPLVGGNIPRDDVYYVMRDTLMANKSLAWLLTSMQGIAIKRDEKSDVSGLKKLLSTLKAGHGLVLYPEGTRSPDGKLRRAKAGIGLMACKSKATIVPVRVFKTREVLGKKNEALNIGPSITVIFGKPMLHQDYDPGKEDPARFQHVADKIMDAIKEIKPIEPTRL